MDRGAWRATVHEVAKSRTQLGKKKKKRKKTKTTTTIILIQVWKGVVLLPGVLVQ